MTAKIRRSFLFLAILQTIHSFEEYVFNLWDYLAPARILSALVSDNLSLGFAVINLAVVALIFWSYIFSIRKAGPHAPGVVWFWAILESLNGIGHIGFGISSDGYFPGLYTAPFLLFVGVFLLLQLTRDQEATQQKLQ